jgi:uncharacterized metal-binding protein
MEGHPLLIEDGQSSNSNRSRILKIGFIILSLLTLALLVALIFVSVSLIKLEASLNNRAAKKPKNLIFFLGGNDLLSFQQRSVSDFSAILGLTFFDQSQSFDFL